MTPRAYLTSRPLTFGHHLQQTWGIAWMKAALQRAAETHGVAGVDRAVRFYDLLERKTNIERRVTALDDYTHLDWDRMRLHAPPPMGDGEATSGHDWHEAPLAGRMAVFAETADALAHDAFAADTEPPDALFQVSCTGYDSPSAVQRMVIDREWGDRTRILSIGHMGCYAAVPALATAADVVQATAARTTLADPEADAPEADARASILLVELCTLHHIPATTDPEQIVQQCLFADGAARLDVTAQPPRGAHFALLDHFETILPDTLDQMTWRPAEVAFRMTLSRAVPDHIRATVAPALGGFLARSGLAVEDVDLFAVHPGGPRVIESTAEALGLDDDRVRHSQAVLRDRGNMSSTTLPHIWAAIADDEAVPEGALICSVAFGPGLTVTGNLLRKGG